jgi:hypothetical protein
MLDPAASGSLQHVLLPETFGRHQTRRTGFTVLSVEIWTTGIVVNMHLTSAAYAQSSLPKIAVEDHFGTTYSLESSATIGPRHLQVFGPSVPAGTRSLTIRSVDDSEPQLVVVLAVPAGKAKPDIKSVRRRPHGIQSRLQRPDATPEQKEAS